MPLSKKGNTYTHMLTHSLTHSALIVVQLMVCAVFTLAHDGYVRPLGLTPHHCLRPPLVNLPLCGLLAHTWVSVSLGSKVAVTRACGPTTAL